MIPCYFQFNTFSMEKRTISVIQINGNSTVTNYLPTPFNIGCICFTLNMLKMIIPISVNFLHIYHKGSKEQLLKLVRNHLSHSFLEVKITYKKG